MITAITASKLVHGVECAEEPARRARRQHHVEMVLANLYVQPFDLDQSRCHAPLWADLETHGLVIGSHDLPIAAAGLALGHDVATLNVGEFQCFSGLRGVDATPFRRQ